jgi:uncharacterized repeat protein (TIGR01451 family)
VQEDQRTDVNKANGGFAMIARISFIPRRLLVPLALMPLLFLASAAEGSAVASAAVTPAPAWQVTDVAIPTVLPPGIGRKGRYVIAVENVGGANSVGEAVVRDVLPAGLTATHVAVEPEEGPLGEVPECPLRSGGEVVCNLPMTVVPSGFLLVKIEWEVTGSVGSLTNVASINGGGAGSITDETSDRLGAEHEKTPAGIAQFRMTATGQAGEPVTQAGGHPHFLTTTLLPNNVREEALTSEEFKPAEQVKDLIFYLPLGMLGDPAVTDPCPASLVQLHGGASACPPSSRVGTVFAMLINAAFADTKDPTNELGIYSIAPEQGYAAEFAFGTNGLTFQIYASVVRRDGVYTLRVAVPGVPATAQLVAMIATFYGDIQEQYTSNGETFTASRGAFLTNPSDCEAGPVEREATAEMDTWKAPGAMLTSSTPVFSSLEGCGLLGFSANLSATPDITTPGDTTQADEPSGYKLDLNTPQAPLAASGLGTPPYKTVDFTFPEGTSLSPGAANGLTACAATGPHGINIEGSESEETAADGLLRPAPGHCPGTSQIGAAKAKTPLLGEELSGHLYLAEPECGNTAHTNPCTPEDAANGTIYRLYLELEAPERGVNIKLAGKAEVNPATGQITSVFEGTPQFPVSNLVIETSGGPRASLANPQTCGTATTTGLIAPWSGGAVVEPEGQFSVNEGCGAQGFTPSLTAGTTNTSAGAFSPFTLTVKREDREQDISSVSSTLPEGLLASVADVAQCPEPQASQGACPASSLIGSATAGIGAGSEPFYQSGKVYFTGPYGGAPFGLSVVVPAVAGPFNLGNVIVRVALFINPTTAQVTAVSSALPQIIDGVPLRIRTVNVTLSNPAFTFNPTSCAGSNITGTIYSTQGAKAGVATPFNAAGCKNLPFKPGFTASTAGKASKANGANLTVKVTSKGGPQAGGEEANIASVKVDLPKQLPSRLTTLQKACTEAQFASNPAGCPSASNVGTATAATPILAHPLVGPAYLVSNGGAAFPDLEIILQGEGVKLVLDGNTFISKAGITSSTFKTVPDAPISSFELKLPTGKFSVLGANVPAKAKYSLCGQALSMPTAITGQNGAVVKQATKIAVTGCAKHKKVKKKAKHGKGKKRKKG